MFLPRFSKDIKNGQARRELIDRVIGEARKAYQSHSMEEAREPVLRLRDQFDEAGLDRLELLYVAESSLAGDPFWLSEIVDILLRQSALTEVQVPYLLRQALMTPERLELWHRLFREHRNSCDDISYFQDREHCAQALLPYFPAESNGECLWPEPLREKEAHNLLVQCMEDTLTNILDLERMDSAARDILRVGLEFFPERGDVVVHLAKVISRDNCQDSESIGLALQALLIEPTDYELKLWCGKALSVTPGHQEEGLAMLRQLYEEQGGSPEVQEAYLSAVKMAELLSDEDEAFLAAWVDLHPEDLRALEMLADQYVARSLLTEEALKVYKLASAHSPKRRNYLRLMGRFYASRSEWSDVIEIFEDVHNPNEETEDVIFPLAMAYSEFQRTDEDAVRIYKRAIELGTLIPEVHHVYCRLLYMQSLEAPESVTQFAQSLKDFPDCKWAQLGMLAHYVRTKDSGRAMDAATALLQENTVDREALKYAGQALAQDFSRKQLAKLSSLQAHAVGQVFEEAYRLQPDAGPIALGLVRHRLANDVRTLETARILGDVCRKNPDGVELRIARGDLLWDLRQEENAVSIYRELLERWRAAGNAHLPRGVSIDTKRRMLQRTGEFLLRPPGPKASDIDILLAAVEEPDTSAEVVLGAARAVVDLQLDEPERLQLIARALRLAPEDRKLERALAEGFAAKGNPTQALELAIRMLQEGDGEEETVSLLRSILAVTTPEQLTPELVEVLQELLASEGPSPQLLLAGMELILHARPCSAEDHLLLESLHELFPRNVRVKRWLAKSFTLTGQEEAAAGILSAMVTEKPEDDELIVELARTHARLGQRDSSRLKIAQAAARIAPESKELQLHLAAIEFNMGSNFQAVGRLRTALEQSPDIHPRILPLLEQCGGAVMEMPEMIFLLSRIHILAGRTEQAMLLLGRLQGEYQKYFTELMHDYGDIILQAPDNPRPRIERGILHRLSGQLDEAIADLRAAHEIAPDNVDILTEYADVLAQKVEGQTPPDPDLCVMVGEIYAELCLDETSHEMVERALSVNPRHQDGMRLLARLQLHARSLNKCQETIRRIEDQAGILPLLQQLSNAFAEQGDHLSAAEVLTDAIEVSGAQRELLEQLRALHQEQARSLRDVSQRQRILQTLSGKAQNRYELRDELGSGSMGVVFKAYDRELDELVVLKILPEHFANNADALAQFRQEAKAARKLAHPNIVRIHDFGEEGGRKHISMEYVSGGDLKKLVKKQGTFSLEEAVRIVKEVAKGLGHAHQEGVLHRDIKAANILISSSGRVKLTDFGIAALLEQAGGSTMDSTHSGSGFGTPLYMAPEQFDGSELCAASDLYSLGVLFYELLAGQPPFMRGSIAYHHQFTRPPRLQDVPHGIWRILERLLEKKTEERFQRAEDLLRAFEQMKESTGA